jgi:hypothetical protein
VIRGRNFYTDSPIQVHLKLGQLDFLILPEENYGAALAVTVPYLGVMAAPQPATLVVQAASDRSNTVDVTVNPVLWTTRLDLSRLKDALTNDFSGTPLVYQAGTAADGATDSFVISSQDSTIYGEHTRAPGSPTANGKDQYFLTTQLKNNWRVVEVAFYGSCGPDQAGNNQSCALLVDYPRSSPSPHVTVQWQTSATSNAAYYGLAFTIYGPKGIPYW